MTWGFWGNAALLGLIWGFPKMVVPNNHGFSYQKWSFWGVLGVPPFKETPICSDVFFSWHGVKKTKKQVIKQNRNAQNKMNFAICSLRTSHCFLAQWGRWLKLSFVNVYTLCWTNALFCWYLVQVEEMRKMLNKFKVFWVPKKKASKMRWLKMSRLKLQKCKRSVMFGWCEGESNSFYSKCFFFWTRVRGLGLVYM